VVAAAIAASRAAARNPVGSLMIIVLAPIKQKRLHCPSLPFQEPIGTQAERKRKRIRGPRADSGEKMAGRLPL
jgi:hypothetical protein